MAAAYNKFNLFTDDLVKGSHVFGTNVFKVLLTNTAPVATNHVTGDITQITQQNGYTTGGGTTTLGIGNSGGVETVTATNVVWTASGGTIGPFQYAVVNNFTQSLLVAWFDYGSAVTLNAGETFTLAPTGGNLFTLT